jgi:hypothetical protein
MDVMQSLSGEAQARHDIMTFDNQRKGRNSFVGFIVIVILLLALCTSESSKPLHDKLAGRELIVVKGNQGNQGNQDNQGYQDNQGNQGNQGNQARVVGVSGVARGEYPFFVRIDIDYYPWCRGSLVAPDVILTAAHCQPEGDETMTVMINGYHSRLKLNKDQEYRQVKYMLHVATSQF